MRCQQKRNEKLMRCELFFINNYFFLIYFFINVGLGKLVRTSTNLKDHEVTNYISLQ